MLRFLPLTCHRWQAQPPTLTQYGPFGQRIDVITVSAAWDRLKATIRSPLLHAFLIPPHPPTSSFFFILRHLWSFLFLPQNPPFDLFNRLLLFCGLFGLFSFYHAKTCPFLLFPYY
jgi:hypothetical protein